MASAKDKQFAALMAELSRPEKRMELEDLLAEPPAPPDFLDRDFDEQCAFIEDPARLKVALCTRRAGKSYGDGLYLFREAFENPRVSCAYFGLTRESAKRIMWKPVFDPINEKFKIGAVPNLSELSWTLPNGSTIYLLGVDSNEREMRKAFGQKFKLAIIDEAALYTIDLSQLVYSLLQPAMADQQGTICLTGMPSNLKRGLFYDLTQQSKDDDKKARFRFEYLDESKRRWKVVDVENGAEWSGHFWTAFENPHMRDVWETEIETKRRLNPRIDETPKFQQEYLGKWVIDSDKFVYKFSRDRNLFDTLPEYDRGSWHFVLGVDLGHEDDSAFVVLAYHDHDDKLYFLETFKAKKLDITQVASYIHEYEERYDFDIVVIDGSNKMAVEEMRRRHDLPGIHAVQKRYKIGDSRRAKANVIEVMNGDFILGRIKINERGCKALIDEYENLIWDDRPSTNPLAPRQEHPSCPNHAADGALYGWLSTHAYLAETPHAGPSPGTDAWHEREVAMLEEQEADHLARAREEEAQAVWDGFESGYLTVIDVAEYWRGR